MKVSAKNGSKMLKFSGQGCKGKGETIDISGTIEIPNTVSRFGSTGFSFVVSRKDGGGDYGGIGKPAFNYLGYDEIPSILGIEDYNQIESNDYYD
ncbi:hypothetical protein AYI70_g3550 [Smittium culicis]|uniref:Uncharacterized protein n=1 Tax=Smittium culicis TaxID=133412 RepID=A0A1R1Y2X7_9FUNG|nr:hypothetical protein AYI70_g3550 [Smittium culicis]